MQYWTHIVRIFVIIILQVTSAFYSVNSPSTYTEKPLRDGGTCDTCGGPYSEKDMDEKMIINGQTVEPTNKYPWMVALLSEPYGESFCGGAIISEIFILSAAHCFRKQAPGSNICNVQDGTGQRCLKAPTEVFVGRLTHLFRVKKGVSVAEIIIHPQFSMAVNVVNDIALLKLQEPIICDEYSVPICMPLPEMDFQEGEIYAIAGWGADNPPYSTKTTDLREARLQLLNPSSCSFLQSFSLTRGSAFCLIGNNQQSPCYGDSGGPLFKSYQGYFYVYGVASAHSSGSCNPREPVVYTNVKSFLDWIYATTSTQESQKISQRRCQENPTGNSYQGQTYTGGRYQPYNVNQNPYLNPFLMYK